MSRDRNSDQPISAEELRLVEALYGETTDEEVEQTDELEGYRGLRAMFADLPDEDPPSAISAKLMSAAAEAVKAQAPEKPGLWARLFSWLQPIAAHPALAAAASLVLVVTIGGVMVMSGRTDVAEPKLERSAAVEGKLDEAPEAPASEATPTDSFDDGIEADKTQFAAPEPEPPTTRRTETISTGEKAAAPKQKPREKKARDITGVKGGAVATKNKDRRPGKGGATGSTGFDLDIADESETEPTPDQKEEPRRPPDLNAAQRQEDSRKSAEVEDLTSKARRAAKNSECVLVREYATRIRKLDREHYNALVARDGLIKRCLSSNKRVKTKK